MNSMVIGVFGIDSKTVSQLSHICWEQACKQWLINRERRRDIKQTQSMAEQNGGAMIFVISLWRNEYKSQEALHGLLHLNMRFSSVSRHTESETLEKPPPKQM
jgi:hypothetical protein